MGSLDEGALEFCTSQPILFVNGKRYVLPDDAAHRTLLEYLRVELGLTGTKLGCGEGGCGACTVMVSHFDLVRQTVIHRAVNACLAPLYSVEGMHVITVEGIGNRKKGLHKVQEALANAHGSQCGFCTPGFVMSMYSLLRSRKEAPTFEEIEESLAGNLCRCTGYRPIFDAFRCFAKSDASVYTSEATSAAGVVGVGSVEGEGICPSSGQPCACGNKSEQKLRNGHVSKGVTGENRLDLEEPTSTGCSTAEPIFPPELLTRKVEPLYLNGMRGLVWYRPTTLNDLLSLKRRFPDAKIVVGNTEIGIETRFKGLIYPVLIGVSSVPELNTINISGDGVVVGASCTLTELLETMRACVNKRPTHETSGCSAFIEQLRWFAGSQIRNVASVGGNICTASPISDLNPLWIASRAEFTVIAHDNTTRKVQAKDFFIGYRKVGLQKTEILLSVFLPWTRRYEYVKEFKQAHRRDDDIALVNAGMRVAFAKCEDRWSVDDVSLVYGGIAAVTVRAPNTESFLIGKPWSQQTIDCALEALQKEVVIAENAPGGMVEFRRSLTCSFFFKFFLHTAYLLESDGDLTHGLAASYKSAAAPYHRDSSHGVQVFEKKVKGTSVGVPVVHASAEMQVTGEAEYCDDVPLPSKGLHAALVLSSRPHAKILSVDSGAAEAQAGFAGFFTAKDVPGGNDIGPVFNDEELFASTVVTAVGQVIGVVVADTYENAKAAAKLVEIEYEDLPAVFSIEDAVEANSFFPGTTRHLHDGDAQKCFESDQCEFVKEGKVQVGGQEHFYLEPNSSLVWTVDGGNEVHMISSTQTPQKHQKYVAHVLGLPMSKVVCKTKRIGGGFGGKETRSAIIAAAASVPAYLLGRAVRLTLDRDVDMLVTGQRHPFLGKYKVGFTKEGRIQALDLQLYSNGGNSMDLSFSVLERAMFHSDNVYAIPNIDIKGDVCKTNLASNTAFRGFGGPQGMLITENWIEHIARVVGKRPEEVRKLNFQTEGYVLHYGQRLEDCRVQRVWEELHTSCDFETRCIEVTKFNTEHRWKKRGVAMVPTKFGISFTAKFLNQAGALVQVYTDGTVLVTHGGVEMGQGLHTKMAQIAASEFDIPLSSVFISETSTDKVPNASATAASASSDLYGGAVLDACQQLKARMEPVAARKQHSSFAELANLCFLERIDLSAHGFYITPDIGFDFSVGKGKPFAYYTFGAAFAEVEIDTLSGDFHTRRVDIVMDLGDSLNPAIDVGQVEGAFIQGLGLVALEEVKWGDRAHPWVRPGQLFTQGPGSYKLPSANDIPIDFRVSLLKDAPNSKAIHSSKAVGEPPLFLASSVLFAIKDAVAAARKDSGFEGFFVLDSPATPERIRMACADQFTLPFAPHNLRPKLSV